MMEKNTELMAVAAPVSTGDNIYPNLPYSSMGAEIQEKENVLRAGGAACQKPQAKPEHIGRIAPASFLYAIFFTFKN